MVSEQSSSHPPLHNQYFPHHLLAEHMAGKDENQKSAKYEANKFDNPNDPLYLHYSDQPGLIPVTQPLNGENYSTWSRAMLMALNIKNKEGFVNGSIKQPPETSIAELQQWRRWNNLVKAWLSNSISQDIATSVIYYEDASEIWSDLKDRFSRTNSVHLFHVEEAIYNCKQDSMTIATYYTKLKGLWDERDALYSFPQCSCSAMKDVLQFQQNQKTMKVLMGLNEIYATVRGQILLMDPLPTINKTHSLVLQEEKQRGMPNRGAPLTEPSAFVVKNNMHRLERFPTPKRPHLQCETCNKPRHTGETCRAHLKCDYCGWSGHTVDICRKLQKTNSISNKPRQREQKNFSSKVNHVDANVPATPKQFTLTGEQYQNLMALLDGSKSNSIANHLNLISISKLVHCPEYVATFTDTACMLQDQRSGKMIGTGTELGGLYYLDTPQATKCNAVTARICSPKL
ncbi:uncharacterized protein [Primulina huaijiensis]|uniref:uncharacterized protein n=1 Tax=Primulina huaijiensis TaxID=1492673 RepID=UPI003CC705CA